MFKRILLPTDFSEYADNALDFGVSIAALSGAVIDIVHVYHVSNLKKRASSTEFEHQEKQLALEASQRLLTLEQKVKQKHPNVQIVTQAEWGIPEIVIQSLAEKGNYDLIVMGTKGTGTEKFFGSTTMNVIDKLSIPTLVIPIKAKCLNMNNFVWASDLELKQVSFIQPLFILAQLFQAAITTVYVRDQHESESSLRNHYAKLAAHFPQNVSNELRLHLGSGELLHELNRVVHASKTNLLCMVMRERSFIEHFLDSSLTTRLAENVDIPLLVLHKSV